MHILFLTDNFPPEVNAPATRTFEHCREWVKAGHKVTVITCAPNFPQGKVFAGFSNKLFARETQDGIDVIRVWTFITANEGFLRRTIDYASFFAAAFPASFFVRKVDVIVATSPQLFAPCAAYAAGLFKRRPYVFELRDLWPESIRAVGAMNNERLLDGLEKLELFLYRRSAAVVSVSNAFIDNLASRGIARDKQHVVTNGADLSRFTPQPRNATLARRLGLEGKFVAGYVGTHGMAHGLTTLLEAARILKSGPAAANARFLLLGDGAEKASLMAKAKEMALDNVLFVDSVQRAEVADYWSLLDVSIIHLKKAPLFETVIPSKLFECMAMGIPVLHGVAGESARIVETEGVGIVFEPENADALADEIRHLAADGELRSRLSKQGPVAARNFDRKALAAKMLKVLESVHDKDQRA
jgi:glycosyltransferase involved in cell wall biosynthesis